MKKLTKSKNNKVVSGVLGGIAEYFDFDPSILRILYSIAIVFGVGSPIILYIILALIMPEAPGSEKSDWHRGFNGTESENKSRKEAEKVNEEKKGTHNDWSDF
ncbi:PspC domain-containing protein [Carnobacterium funditum]|uniref:PspC domain-containing protein n=1 Tax=Carnobacterium funditum TaxID=2752 RepID=UPI000550628D|nr:PspC domain-containing protein [Carnobacterium funditum]